MRFIPIFTLWLQFLFSVLLCLRLPLIPPISCLLILSLPSLPLLLRFLLYFSGFYALPTSGHLFPRPQHFFFFISTAFSSICFSFGCFLSLCCLLEFFCFILLSLQLLLIYSLSTSSSLCSPLLLLLLPLYFI